MKKLLIFAFAAIVLFGFKAINQKKITGIVTDEQGHALPGVSVVSDVSRAKTISDASGKYSISVSEKDKNLNFYYIGFLVKKMAIKQNTINAVMKPNNQALSEVVIVGNAKPMQKRNSTAYMAQADMTVSSSPPSILRNKVAGISIASQENTESYSSIAENGFHSAQNDPLSTFSIDVDAASYTNMRRFINNGTLPPPDAVRIEEMINYFDYHYQQPKNNVPVNIVTETANAPWNTAHKLVQIGLQGKTISTDNLPASNLVFLIDVSGSMYAQNKLPLLVSSFKLLTDQLRAKDKVAIVVYAGNSGLVLPATSGDKKTIIKDALDKLVAGGSTAGGEGIELAYKVATENFVKGGNNRVILATDGDFNVGASSDGDMESLIETKRKTGIFLTVLGFGMGNYKDSKMEILADKGNGNYAYIDNINEARKTLISQFGGTLFTIAKDVKLQVEFNPARVSAYRLIGYENRLLNKEDFNDDKKDAGELGSGHTVTALYEIIPVGINDSFSRSVDALKYQKPSKTNTVDNGELLTVKLRYKDPDGDKSRLLSKAVLDNPLSFTATSDNFRFATAVAEFGMVLRQSKFRQNASFDHAVSLAESAKGTDKEGYRSEFVSLVKSAKLLTKSSNLSLKDRLIMNGED
ncbi:Ca-activated chloride channel family protein [Pedobacter sp. UYP30]|uniref:YfbK domain-containing protein n=1 Tax=Pedobacter sp. UYP30 TaxID=1756400 RepID=UPI003395C620